MEIYIQKNPKEANNKLKDHNKIESILEGRADSDVSSYSIQGRSLTKLGIEELMAWRDRYKSELLLEKRKERALNGRGTGAKVLVRF